MNVPKRRSLLLAWFCAVLVVASTGVRAVTKSASFDPEPLEILRQEIVALRHLIPPASAEAASSTDSLRSVGRASRTAQLLEGFQSRVKKEIRTVRTEKDKQALWELFSEEARLFLWQMSREQRSHWPMRPHVLS